ncbi:hydantoinase/carbamoylase family amidase|uniref:N-carbamoyl-L-amino-acid hydrolase n=1 Tax=Dendrosporobacter quercicolus TaxID=146817 RepID=A0A1G9SL04_9FIRM|nr:hydantoinase/carbamoylase family amidase [Dendrosporobacter quercicolus]NSL48681.1 hydantoinase/carbamoylase family amidase [Dendrosporobacter quercicolus DSM 1736]SDM36174.1 N-carbamoyl-L-amino-acid hydrolase [Dendrosporobacter quercicolus]
MANLKFPVSINPDRILRRLSDLAQIGRNTAGGIDRQLASPGDTEARAWLMNCWTAELGLEVYIDPIANIWGGLPNGSGKTNPIVVGSHHDTVPNGGMFDGALGVIVATELMQTIRESKLAMRHPLQIVSFTGEEANPFAVSTLGSKVLSGRLGVSDLVKACNIDTGESLESAISRLGGNIKKAGEAELAPDSVAAFLECHIEQGRRLYDLNLPVASVSCITGIYREVITVFGEANHAGTTKVEDRRDALNAASEICLAVEQIMRLPNMDNLSATVGRIDTVPNASNIIPGMVTMTLDLRTAEPEKKERALRYLTEAIEKISSQRQVQIERTVNLDQPEMPMNPMITAAFDEAMELLGEPKISLVSMAGHDAAHLARVTKAGMLFVQSIGGFSHCPQEMTGEQEVVRAAQVMLDALLILDGRLE